MTGGMEREFPEIGVLIGGAEYGMFSVKATWDVWGCISHMDIEPQSANHKTLCLERRKLFHGFAGPGKIMYPNMQQMLWQGLEDAIENAMTDDRELWSIRQKAEGRVA